MPPKLMIPGPVEVEDDVLDWLSQPVQAHYGDEWVAVHNETIGLLQQVFRTQGKVFMMPGSGSLVGDSAIHNLFASGDRVAVGVNGHFGVRWVEILEAQGIEMVRVDTPPDQPLDPTVFERLLVNDPSIAGVAVVHLETSTAVLNPVREIAAICRAHNRLCVVDAVSSLAVTPFEMDAWGIDVTTTASQKGLGGLAGLGIIAVGERAWDVIMSQPERPHSWYLDLRRWQWYVENWGYWHPFPVTMPCSVVLALRAALKSLLADGLDRRLQRYERQAKRLRDGLEAVGMRLFVPADLMSPGLTAAYCPPGVTSGEIVTYLAKMHDIRITSGFREFKDSVIRIGHMGGALDETDIDDLLGALRQFLHERQTQPVK